MLYWLWNYDKDMMVTVLVLMLVVILASMGRFAGQRINRKFKKSGQTTVPLGMLQFLALLIGAVVLVFAFAVSPKENYQWPSIKWFVLLRISRHYGISGRCFGQAPSVW